MPNLMDSHYADLHNITLRVIDASPDARLTVTKARVNGANLGDKQ